MTTDYNIRRDMKTTKAYMTTDNRLQTAARTDLQVARTDLQSGRCEYKGLQPENRIANADTHCEQIANPLEHCGMVMRSVLQLLLLLVGGAVTGAWADEVTYHIINLGRLDDSCNIVSSNRTEALQFTSTENTVGVPGQYKSPLATGWKYYKASEVTETPGSGSTKTSYTFNS